MSKFDLKEVYKNLVNEYKKIYWPSKVEVFHVTIIVLIITLFVVLYTLFFDLAFSFALERIKEIIGSFLGGAK